MNSDLVVLKRWRLEVLTCLNQSRLESNLLVVELAKVEKEMLVMQE